MPRVLKTPAFCFWLALLINSYFPMMVFADDNAVGAGRGFHQEGETLYSNNPVVARVEGKAVYMDELKNARIQDMLIRLYQMQSLLLKKKVVDQLAASHPELKPDIESQITEKEIRDFYQNEPGIKDLGELDQLRDQIRNLLEKMRREGFSKDLDRRYQIAVSNGWVEDFLEPPTDFLLQAELGTAMLWFKGEEGQNRKVFVMEFSDFLCPFCRKVQRTIRELRSKYADTVQFGYRHFPIHEEARILSEAVECARDQGRFWEMQSLVYHDPRRIRESKDELLKSARRAGVRNMASFESCLDSGKYQNRVQKDMEDGVALGIQGTPTFIIGLYNPSSATVNGEMFSGAVPPGKFIHLIEKYLNRSQ